MFDFDAGKLLIVGVVALIFIPPKDLPRVLRQVGQFVGKMRRMASEFQGQFMDAMREADMTDLRQEARKLADAARIDVGAGSVSDLKSHLTGAIEGKPMILDTTSAGAPLGDAGLVDPNPELRRLVGGNGAAPALELSSPVAQADKPGRAEDVAPATSGPIKSEAAMSGSAMSDHSKGAPATSEKAAALSRSA